MPTMTREDIRKRDAELCAVIEQQQEQLRAVLAHVEELRANNERLKAENKRAVVECARLNELFTLKWDATQSAETGATRAEIERLEAESEISDGLLADAKAAIAYVRQRSQQACEILNEFDNTHASPVPARDM